MRCWQPAPVSACMWCRGHQQAWQAGLPCMHARSTISRLQQPSPSHAHLSCCCVHGGCVSWLASSLLLGPACSRHSLSALSGPGLRMRCVVRTAQHIQRFQHTGPALACSGCWEMSCSGRRRPPSPGLVPSGSECCSCSRQAHQQCCPGSCAPDKLLMQACRLRPGSADVPATGQRGACSHLERVLVLQGGACTPGAAGQAQPGAAAAAGQACRAAAAATAAGSCV